MDKKYIVFEGHARVTSDSIVQECSAASWSRYLPVSIQSSGNSTRGKKQLIHNFIDFDILLIVTILNGSNI